MDCNFIGYSFSRGYRVYLSKVVSAFREAFFSSSNSYLVKIFPYAILGTSLLQGCLRVIINYHAKQSVNLLRAYDFNSSHIIIFQCLGLEICDIIIDQMMNKYENIVIARISQEIRKKQLDELKGSVNLAKMNSSSNLEHFSNVLRANANSSFYLTSLCSKFITGATLFTYAIYYLPIYTESFSIVPCWAMRVGIGAFLAVNYLFSSYLTSQHTKVEKVDEAAQSGLRMSIDRLVTQLTNPAIPADKIAASVSAVDKSLDRLDSCQLERENIIPTMRENWFRSMYLIFRVALYITTDYQSKKAVEASLDSVSIINDLYRRLFLGFKDLNLAFSSYNKLEHYHLVRSVKLRNFHEGTIDTLGSPTHAHRASGHFTSTSSPPCLRRGSSATSFVASSSAIHSETASITHRKESPGLHS